MIKPFLPRLTSDNEMQTPLEPLISAAAIGMQSISHAFYHLHGWLRSLDESEAFTYWTSRY